MECASVCELEELEEFHRLVVADALGRYEKERTQEAKEDYLRVLKRFATQVMDGQRPITTAPRRVKSRPQGAARHSN